MKDKYLWFTDTHLDKVTLWKKYAFLKYLQQENPKGIIITGDISNGRNTCEDLEMIAKAVTCNIYFVLGNHDYHWCSIDEMHDRIRALCKKYPHLVWMTEAGVVHINDEVCFIGTEGWYDAENGKPEYLQFTFDWFLVEDFRSLPDMNTRIKAWRKLAKQSQDRIEDLLEKAIEQKYKNVYVLTHFPPWKEATRDQGTLLEKFWLPYNCNLHMGRGIEKVMAEHKKKHCTVLAGHTHTDCWIHVARNIECKVNKAKYYDSVRNEEHIFI